MPASEKQIQNSCLFSLEKLSVLTAGPGNIPHTPKQQAADGKGNVESQNLFPDALGVTYGNRITDLTLH